MLLSGRAANGALCAGKAAFAERFEGAVYSFYRLLIALFYKYNFVSLPDTAFYFQNTPGREDFYLILSVWSIFSLAGNKSSPED